jgi:hypothetical protein
MVARATASPAEAFAWIRCERLFRSPILDVQMPESDCPTCAAETRRRYAKALQPGKAIQGRETCPAVGVNDALCSPIRGARTVATAVAATSRELLTTARSAALGDAAGFVRRIQGESKMVGAALEAVLQGVP